MSNEWISHKIKEPIDLTKVDWDFWRQGLAVPIFQEQEIPTEDLDSGIEDEDNEDIIEFDVDEFEE